jgi:uncharacterized protein (DUF58 family)
MGLCASAGVSLWFFGYGALDQVWYVAGVALLSLSCCALLLVMAATLRMRFALRAKASARGEPESLDTLTFRETGFALPSLWLWPFVDVVLSVREPGHVHVRARAERFRLSEALSSSDHGELREVVRAIEVRDVFGVASMTLCRRAPVCFDVLPHVGALRTLPLLRSLSGGEDVSHPMGITQGDRLELRRYAPGDPARFIHWKVYARSQKLVVRMPERALSRAHRVAAYLVAGPNDAASAAAARVALEERAFGDDFRFGADGFDAATDRVPEALSAIRRSAHARAGGGRGLSAFLDGVEREGPVSLILFVPASLGQISERLKDVLSRRTRPARVVIGVDGVERDEQASIWERLAMVPKSGHSVPVSVLRDTIAFYRKLSADVVIVDRRTGRLLSEAHFARVESATERAA